MSYVAKGDKEYDATGAPLPPAKIHKIRITLTCGTVKNLEKCPRFTLLLPLGQCPYSSNCSLDGSHKQGKGQEPSCEGTRQTPHEGLKGYHP